MPDWQTIATLLCLAAAGLFAVRRLFRFARGAGQGGCGSCGTNNVHPEAKPLVPLEPPHQRDESP